MKTLTADQLADHARVVVWGEVVQIEVQAASGYRSALVEAREIVRAPEEYAGLRDFRVALENRAMRTGDLIERVAGAPELRVGDEVLAFLDPLERELHPQRFEGGGETPLFSLRGFQQGIYRVYADAAGVRRAVAWNEVATPAVRAADLQVRQSGARKRRASVSPPLPAELRTRDLPTLDSLSNRVRAKTWTPAPREGARQ